MSAGVTATAILRLDAWLETMRGPAGYGGPVAHWWHSCLLYTGVGLDWRYEGIVLGYLALYQKTGEEAWLARAHRAGDDLLRGQLPGGGFRSSSFEQNPHGGGTPHEAACDLALLRLAEVLKDRGRPYHDAAERNLRGRYLAELWDEEARRFWDHPRLHSFVPNKAATLAEALLVWAGRAGDEELASHYALPTLGAILGHQVRGGPLDGAIDQVSQDGQRAGRYFPYYIARCVPGLLAGYRWSGDEALLDAACRAARFVLRWRADDGSFPQVVYADRRVNRYPQWIAGAGDLLRALDLVASFGLEVDAEPTLRWLLAGQELSGAIRTARGFAAQASQRAPGAVPEFRDLLPVAGWNDKAFRCLAERFPEAEAAGLRPSVGDIPQVTAECFYRGARLKYRETGQVVETRCGEKLCYRWRKGEPWADAAAPEYWVG